MYQNTKLFWVTIVAVAILSMFHSSVSLGNAATLYGYSKCPLKIDATKPYRYRPKWSWDMDDTKDEECIYRLDEGHAVKCFKGFFQPDRDISPGIHTFHVNFTCADGVKESFQVRYETSTAEMTKIDRQNDSDTAENADKPNVFMPDPANGEEWEQPPPASTNGELEALPHLAPDDGKQRVPPHAPVNGQETIMPPIIEENVCDDKPPRKFTMSGRIVDANTGRGISGAKVVVLTPGTFIYEYDAFLDSSSILSQAVTDKSGNYTLSRRLRNGRKYSMFISAVGYKRYKIDERLMSTCSKSLTEKFKLRPLRY